MAGLGSYHQLELNPGAEPIIQAAVKQFSTFVLVAKASHAASFARRRVPLALSKSSSKAVLYLPLLGWDG